MDTIEEGIFNALIRSAPKLQKLEIRHFGNKPFIYTLHSCTVQRFGAAPMGAAAAESWSLRTNGCHNLFRFVLCPNTAGMQPFSHQWTFIEMCGITSALHIEIELAALTQLVACLPLVQQFRGSIPGGVVNLHLKISTSGLGGVDMYTF